MRDDFVVKDSGQRVQFPSGMQRDVQDDKVRFDLMIPVDFPFEETMFFRWALLLTRGAKKYSARNWELAEGQEEEERFRASAFRHFMQWFSGDRSEDHASAVFFNINGAEFVRSKTLRKELD